MVARGRPRSAALRHGPLAGTAPMHRARLRESGRFAARRSAACVERARMPRLGEGELTPARESEGGRACSGPHLTRQGARMQVMAIVTSEEHVLLLEAVDMVQPA